MPLQTPTRVLAILLAAASAACSHSQAHTESVVAPPTVSVAEVLSQPLRHWEELTGELQAVNTVEVHPRVSGFIDNVQFKEGARVSKGQVLFQIDRRSLILRSRTVRAPNVFFHRTLLRARNMNN
jgi:multidrug efflux system membrane fusion protein